MACHCDMIGKDLLHPSFIVDMRSKNIYTLQGPSGKNRGNSYNSNNSINNNKNDDGDIEDEDEDDYDSLMIDHTQALIPENYDLNKLFIIPRVEIEMRRCHRDDWSLFKKYHYKTQTIATNVRCFSGYAKYYLDNGWGNNGLKTILANDSNYINCDLLELMVPQESQLAVFTAVINRFGVNAKDDGLKYDFREHRTVVLPQYQGLSIGSRFSDSVGELLSIENLRLQSKTAHPRFGIYRDNSCLWKPMTTNHKVQYAQDWNNKKYDEPSEDENNEKNEKNEKHKNQDKNKEKEKDGNGDNMMDNVNIVNNSNEKEKEKEKDKEKGKDKNTGKKKRRKRKSNKNKNENKNNKNGNGNENEEKVKKMYYSHVYRLRNEREKEHWDKVKGRMVIQGIDNPYSYNGLQSQSNGFHSLLNSYDSGNNSNSNNNNNNNNSIVGNESGDFLFSSKLFDLDDQL